MVAVSVCEAAKLPSGLIMSSLQLGELVAVRLNSLEVKLVGCRKLTEQCAVGLNSGGVIAMGCFEAAELGPLRLYNACVACMCSLQLGIQGSHLSAGITCSSSLLAIRL